MSVIYVPPPQPSRKAKELGAAIAHLTLEYQSREGKLSGGEMRMAMQIAQAELRKQQRGGGDNRLLIISLVIGLALLVLAGILVFGFTLRG